MNVFNINERESLMDHIHKVLRQVYGEVEVSNIEVELYYEDDGTEFYDVFYLEQQIALLSIFPDQIVIKFQPI